MEKKGASLALNVIVVAVLVLIVLVVILVLFGGKMKMFGEATNSCSDNNGICQPSCAGNEAKLPFACESPNVCCKVVYDTGDTNG
ncbi:hypothetical protein J4460_00315 [Candidatus Woesearchaeota archaeon]|nr:MAG: hypothetical protein QS99_C0002G0125 [archaeon GW2011_AR4]MBS3129093.1 hypothetical protein [Candidatus Woesearchaeota archaeon]HIH37825.1 hypothetical protein [Candidatus Woesearchaeota archaeon]HIH49281.1 hypothetical protein [Candidatus Woesearchaeota archaeon]HIJ03950.1 hypothetical protein [Candidatus Woesearchaeota archaeon]